MIAAAKRAASIRSVPKLLLAPNPASDLSALPAASLAAGSTIPPHPRRRGASDLGGDSRLAAERVPTSSVATVPRCRRRHGRRDLRAWAIAPARSGCWWSCRRRRSWAPVTTAVWPLLRHSADGERSPGRGSGWACRAVPLARVRRRLRSVQRVVRIRTKRSSLRPPRARYRTAARLGFRRVRLVGQRPAVAAAVASLRPSPAGDVAAPGRCRPRSGLAGARTADAAPLMTERRRGSG